MNADGSDRKEGERIRGFNPGIAGFWAQLPRKLQNEIKFRLENGREGGKLGDSSRKEEKPSADFEAALKEQMQPWKENPTWIQSTPEIKVTVPKGSFCNLGATVNIGLPPDAVYDIVIDPDNKRVFKNIKEVISREVLFDDGMKQVVNVEQAAIWKFLWWSGTFSVHVLVEQNRADHTIWNSGLHFCGAICHFSDTAVASTLEEFQLLRFNREDLSLEKWGNSDEEFHIYDLNLKEVTSTSWLTKLPSIAKNGVKFSGTEARLTILENLDLLVIEIKQFFQKLLILNIPNITFELAVQEENSHEPVYKDIFLPNIWHPIPFSASNIEKLKHGLAFYVMEKRFLPMNNYGIDLSDRMNFKFGIGSVCRPENYRRQASSIIMEAVVIMSDIPGVEDPRLRESNSLTKVLYFQDFTLMTLSEPCQAALWRIDWKSYGLTLDKIVEQGHCSTLKWENLLPDSHIDIVFHCYQANFPPKKRKYPCYKNLLKEAAKLALDDLKEKHAGSLLSESAIKVCSHAPDLARTLAGLIMSSNDITFQGECLSLLGLDCNGIANEAVEECIENKLISVIELNDRKPKGKKLAAPFLFKDNDGCYQVPSLLEEEYTQSDDHTSNPNRVVILSEQLTRYASDWSF